MKPSAIITLLFSIHLFNQVLCEVEFDYYWRDYYGVAPGDAVPGGLDMNGKSTYIGQVYVEKHGIQPVRIYSGKTEVTASQDGIYNLDSFIKILCSTQQEKLVWIPGNSTHLQVQTIGKHVVSGGNENGRILNIGRTQYQGELIVGKVCAYNIHNALLFFPYKNSEKNSQSYEILIYENNNLPDVAIRITEN